MKDQKVIIKNGDLKDKEFIVEGKWQDVSGESWKKSALRNPAAMNYAIRIHMQEFKVPLDENVFYGKIGSLGHLVHEKELA